MTTKIRVLLVAICFCSALVGEYLLIKAVTRLSLDRQAVSSHFLPDPALTPGDTRVVDLDTLCTSGTAKVARNVLPSVRKSVFAAYGLAKTHDGWCHTAQGCELDHLISLEIGGSNNAKNLFPQPYVGEWNAHMKDRLENRLHHMVCNKEIDLATAQTAIRTNWIEAYKKYVTQ